MKAGNHARAAKAVKPEKNQNNKLLIAGVLGIIAVALIIWVWALGRKADKTIAVCMYKTDIYKNETISDPDETFIKYDMSKLEYEKYTVTDKDGTKRRRILLWDERDKVVGCFAAYNSQENTIAFYSDFITERVSNSDTILYSYPGKVIIPLEVGDSDLDSFKSLLQPGDKVNIIATYKKDSKISVKDGLGNDNESSVSLSVTETMFENILLADLLNDEGSSILDLYEYYNGLSVYEQANLDASEDWKQQTTPSKILLALTPEEQDRYYYYLSKDGATFKMTLNQRNS